VVVLRKKSIRDEFVNKNLRETLDCSLPFARIVSAFEMNNIQKRRVTCYGKGFSCCGVLAKDRNSFTEPVESWRLVDVASLSGQHRKDPISSEARV
jgi:hypothetical protein